MDDHPVPQTDPAIRARALQSLLIEKELLSTDAVDEIVSAYEEDIGPMNGAEVVARAWTDPDYRAWLLEDGTAAIADEGYTGVQGVDIEVCENTTAVHNVIVCTLCSCYPWPVLGLPPTWYKSPPYRSRIVKRPRETLREEFGLALDEDLEIRVRDSSSEVRYMVLPRRPPGTADRGREELARLVTRDAMIGVERLGDADVAEVSADGGDWHRPTKGPPGWPATRDRGRPDPDRSDGLRRTEMAVRRDVEFPGTDADPRFDAPWQARAFAMVVALRHEAMLEWRAFRRRLGEEVRGGRMASHGPAGDGGAIANVDGTEAELVYYEAWLRALERVLVASGIVDAAALAARAVAFAAGERDASEFVYGDRGHGHDHDHGH